MIGSHPVTARGRPRTITRERLSDAGIEITLPNVTILGIAAHLGVSAKALYKHVSGLEELKQQIAEDLFLRWELPPPAPDGGEGLESFMLSFSQSMWMLVEQHPGIAPYILREDLITPAMMQKMEEHQQGVARIFGIPFTRANWLLFIVAYFCVSVADTVLPIKDGEEVLPHRGGMKRADWIKAQYDLGARALIVGSLATMDQIPEG